MGTIFQAPQYDPRREKRRRKILLIAAAVVVVIAVLAWTFRYWPEERVVDRFFAALEQKDYEKAYGIYLHDPDWKQHPDQYAARYSFRDFYNDWGPGGEWGIIRSYKILGAGSPPKGGSGVIVEVRINDRVEPARIWVEKSDKTLTAPSPY